MVEMMPAYAVCKAFASKLSGAAWESGFHDSVQLTSVMPGTEMKHLGEVIQLRQPDVCQVTHLGAARCLAVELLALSNRTCSRQVVLLSEVTVVSAQALPSHTL